MALKNFLRKNLQASERSSEAHQIDMEGLIAQSNQIEGELGDQLSGKRKLKAHKHHQPKDLADALIANIEAIVKLRREIEK